MKNFLALTTIVAISAGTLATGGCVSKQQYDEALAASRRATEQLENSQLALREARTENEDLKSRLAASGGLTSSKDEEIALLAQAKADLQSDYDKLKALYDESLRAGPNPPELGPIVLPVQVDKALKEFATANPELLDYLPEYGMVKIKSDLTFEPGSDIVKPAAQDALGKLVAVVNSPEAAEFNVYIAGHTDDMRISRAETKRRHPDNWYLSAHRGIAVQQVLAKAGLPAERIGVLGFSEYHPVAPNKPGKKGNVANRRVEIWIVPQDRLLTAGIVEEAPSK